MRQASRLVPGNVVLDDDNRRGRISEIDHVGDKVILAFSTTEVRLELCRGDFIAVVLDVQ